MDNGDRNLVNLDLRGKRLNLERGLLMELPESILLCLFPNGIILNEHMEDDEVYYVDFDGDCLQFVLRFFDQARYQFYGAPTSALRQQRYLPEQGDPGNMQDLLFHKQAIIVLREELEYFAIPPSTSQPEASADAAETEKQQVPGTDEHGNANEALMDLKNESGKHLLNRKSIFTALQRNVNRENNVAEQHLIDMLCMSGFGRDDEWGYRAMEPNRCCITSIALVLLKTGITQPEVSADPDTALPIIDGQPPPMAPGVTVNSNQLATAQKLLLFWRKPARKCWWDALEVSLPGSDGKMVPTKIHVRRIWTLELSCI